MKSHNWRSNSLTSRPHSSTFDIMPQRHQSYLQVVAMYVCMYVCISLSIDRIHVFQTRWDHLHIKRQAFKISRLFYIPQQLYLIYWKWCQYTHRKNIDGNYIKTLWFFLKKKMETAPPKTAALAPISQTIQVKRITHAGGCWRNRNVLISEVLLWVPTHGRIIVGQPAKTYIRQLYVDTVPRRGQAKSDGQ